MNLAFLDQNKDIRDSYLENKTSLKIITNNEEQTIEQVLRELDSLIGLEKVKQEIKTLINFLKIQKARESSGLKSSPISHHIVFTGNPGTGKTTVARIVAKIYKSLGIISQGQLVETDRSGLIGEYVGHTAIKVNKIIDSAINGVLFIDEAYSISGESYPLYQPHLCFKSKAMDICFHGNKRIKFVSNYADTYFSLQVKQTNCSSLL